MKNPQRVPSEEKHTVKKVRPAWMYFALGGGIALLGAICLASLGLVMFPQVRGELMAILTPKPPTPPCVSASLTIGSGSLKIETIKREQDGSIAVPPDQPGIAYWVEGGGVGYVFALSPTAENMVLLASVREGDPLQIAWGDCSAESFTVRAKEISQPDLGEILSAPGVTIFAADRRTGSAIVLRSETRQEFPVESASSEEAGVQAEINFLDTVIAPDGKTITMGIEITNTGNEPIDLTSADIDLTPEGEAPIAPLYVTPPLPQQVQPGASLSLQITFSKPGGSTAVFRILDFSVDQYY